MWTVTFIRPVHKIGTKSRYLPIQFNPINFPF